MPPPRKPHNPTQEAVDKASEAVFEKGLPSNIDAERFVLGSVMLNHQNYSQMVAALQPDDFSLEKHRRIYQRMKDIADRNEIINRVTIADELLKQGQLESVDGLGYLMSLDQNIPELSSIESYIGIVKKKSLLRQIIWDSQRRIDQALAEAEPKDIIAAGMESMRGMHISNEGVAPGRSPEQIVEQFPGGISAFLDPTRRPKGLPTGFTKFDEWTNGLHRGELTVLGARPAMGKSAILANMLAFLCLNPRQRRRCSLFSLEMPGEQILTRIMCSEARVDQHKFRSGFLNAEERRRLQIALDDIINCGLRIYDKYGIDMPELEECIRRDVKDNGCDVAGVDYLQLIGVKKGENRNLEIGAVTRRLKLICGPTECNIPLIVLSQLSRAGDKRSGGGARPILSDLRDSGSIEQDADNVIFLHREEIFKKDREDLRGLADLEIAKQRNGPIGIVPLRFIGCFLRFENKLEDIMDEQIPGNFVS